MRKTVIAILCFAATLSVFGCAVKHEPEKEPLDWKLSSESALTYYYLQSLDARARKSFSESAVFLGKAIEISPSPSLYMEMARSYWRGQDRNAAIMAMEEAVNKFSDEPGLYLFLAELFLVDDKMEEALAVLEDYWEIVPDDPDEYRELAMLYIDMRDFPQALDVFEKIPEDQRTPEVLYYMGRASNELNDRKKAISFLKKAVDKDPLYLQAWAELAYIYEQERDYLQAEEIYEKLLYFGERNPELILRIIELNLRLNNPDKALHFLERGPVDVQFHLDVASQFINNSFYNHAYEILQGITQRGAYPPTVNFYLALIAYRGWSDPDKALEYLGNIPEDDYYHLQALSFSIEIYFAQEEYSDALEVARLGLEIHPSASRFVLFESIILEVMGEYSKALKTIQSGLEKWPTDTELLFRKGIVLDKKDQKDRAMQVMEEIISIDQDHHEALNYIGYTLAEQGKDLDRALVLIKRALSMDPVNGYYIDSLAWVFYMLEEYEKAWTEIQRAVEFVDDNPIIWEHYGDIAMVLDLPEQALYGYQMALENEPENLENILEKKEMLRSNIPDIQSGHNQQ